MSNQPLGFSRVTAHDVISLTSMKLHPSIDHLNIYVYVHVCCLCHPRTEHSFTGNLRREPPEPNSLLRCRSQLAGYKKLEPNTNPYSSGPSSALHKHPNNF